MYSYIVAALGYYTRKIVLRAHRSGMGGHSLYRRNALKLLPTNKLINVIIYCGGTR